MIRPGEVYLVDLPGGGRRPAVVVSREELNRGTYVVLVPCTTAGFARRSTLPNYVPFRAGQFGFTADCVAQCELIAFQDVDLAAGPIGVLDDSAFRDVVRAVGHVLGSDCEPV